jgi:hypothetical protein
MVMASNDSDKVRLCAEALVRLNGESISSFADGTRAAAICAISYERIYRKALVMNRWSFTRAYKVLDPLGDNQSDPKTHLWVYKYKLPADCINLIGVMFSDGGEEPVSMAYGINPMCQNGRLDSYSTNYELRDGCVYANGKRIAIDYQYAVPENMLGQYPLFREYLVLLLASEFAVSVMNDDVKLQRFTALAQEAFGIAASTDSSNNPVPFTNYSMTVAKMRTFG